MIKWDIKDYTFLAIVFLIFEVVALVRDYFSYRSMLHLLWFCNYAPLLLAVAFFFKRKDFIKAIINVGLVVQTVFLFIYVALMTTGRFEYRGLSLGMSPSLFVITTIIIHIVILVALYVTYQEKPTRRSLYLSFAILLFMYFSVILFAPPENQINLVYSYGNIIKIDIPFYTFLWPILAFILIVLPSYWIQNKLYERHVRKKGKTVVK
jgi:hypothetical protein